METRNKVKLGGGVIAAALMVMIPFTGDREGLSLQAYKDVVGVWTICNGETLGVKKGDVMTKEQCRTLLKSRAGQFMQAVADKITYPITAKTLAAHSDFAYNVGVGGYSTSKALALTNAGRVAEGCTAMYNWKYLTIKNVKYDCSRPQNIQNIQGCRGLMNRRTDEVSLCLQGTAK